MTVRRNLANIAHIADANYKVSLSDLVVDEPWMAYSLCRETDPEAFFPEKGGSTREAKAICAACTVAFECLKYALENDERHGIWGGASERERRKIKRRMDRKVRAA